MKNRQIIPSVNFHLTRACNMKCTYCFACFKNTGATYPYEDTLKLLEMFRNSGIRKINFVGGEPVLIKNISQIIKLAKELGFYTSIVTNGSLITNKFLEEVASYLDLIGLSIDSLNRDTNSKIGRKTQSISMGENDYKRIVNLIKKYGIDLKINTVVSQFNKNEKFYDFINEVKPLRWKVFQVLNVKGENDKNFNELKVTKGQFTSFCDRHLSRLSDEGILIKEGNNIMRGSYLMIDPDGRFFDNTKGKYTLSDKIIEKGVALCLSQINYDYSKFIYRNGDYFEKTEKYELKSA